MLVLILVRMSFMRVMMVMLAAAAAVIMNMRAFMNHCMLYIEMSKQL